MKIKLIEIENYKSIASKQKLYLSDGTTTIIGKNESGKSNLLEVIGNISINSLTEKKLIEQGNSRNLNSETILSFTFTISNEQAEFLGVDSLDTVIKFNTNEDPFSGIVVSGFHKEYFSDKKFKNNLEKIKEIVTGNVSKDQNFYRNLIQKSIPTLEQLEFYHKVSWEFQMAELKKANRYLSDESLKIEYNLLIKSVKNYIERIYNQFPIIFNYKEDTLKSRYSFKLEDFDNIEAKHGISFIIFLQLVNFSYSDLQDILFSNNIGRKTDLRDKLTLNIKKYINEPFKNFYNQEDIELIVDVSGNIFSFLVKSSNTNISFSERSDGLRWYLNLFISLQSVTNNKSNNVLFLIDEPGVYLHVDAQKTLRKLFDRLAENNQIVYSTHSPFMIDENDLSNIRVTQKNSNSDTEIINNIFSDKISNTSKREALSPLLSSIGMSGGSIFDIDTNKLNVITEGITDAMYLNAMSDLLDEDKFVFIPSIGASNIYSIGLILWAWNLNYIGLFDYDDTGRREEDKIKRKIDSIKTLNLSVTNLGDNIEIEDLFDSEDYKNCNFDLKDLKGDNKKLYAKKMIDMIQKSPEKISDATKNNFKILFDELKL